MSQRDFGIGVRPGDVLAGKYRVERVLGAGGMGVVVAAHHIQLDSKVAIKFLLPAMLEIEDAVTRFTNEARRAVKFTSEHVARVLDVGTLENGAPYMVMEFLEGGDLSGWLKEKGALPVELAVDFLLQACVAVADAHALGIVHRDLKPANMFCVRRSDGQLSIKVLDFGISKMTRSAGASDPSSSSMGMTRTTSVMGSPLYMSPEQMQSPKDVGLPSDIWALGVVLFELLTGRAPFEGETYAEIAVKVATKAPPSIRQLRPEVPAPLQAVIEKCLQRDPRRRYVDVGQLASALAPFGPVRARTSVDRISGILRDAGFPESKADVTMPSSHETAFAPETDETGLAPETIAPVGGTAPGVPKKRRVAIGGAVAGALAVLVAGVAMRAVWPASHTDARSDEGVASAGVGGAGASQASPPSPRPPPPPEPVNLAPAPDSLLRAADPVSGSAGLGADAGAVTHGSRVRERSHASPAHTHPVQGPPSPALPEAAPPTPQRVQPAAPPSPPEPPQSSPNDDPLSKLRPK